MENVIQWMRIERNCTLPSNLSIIISFSIVYKEFYEYQYRISVYLKSRRLSGHYYILIFIGFEAFFTH